MMKTLITVLLSSFHTSFIAAAACECQPIGPPNSTSYIVTRLWNINPSSNFTDQDVIAEFDNGFAPVVTHMPGFQRYTASTTGNTSTVIFMNAFDTSEHASAAQTAAKDFVSNGVLKNVITPNTFTEDEVVVGFSRDECITESYVGKFLAARVFQYDDDYIRPDDQVEVFTTINELALTVPGYDMLVMSQSEESERPIVDFRYNIYDTEDQAAAVHDVIAPLAANGTFGSVNSLDNLKVTTRGIVAFDYMCAVPGDLPEIKAEDPSGDETVDASTDKLQDEDPSSDGRVLVTWKIAVALQLAMVIFHSI